MSIGEEEDVPIEPPHHAEVKGGGWGKSMSVFGSSTALHRG